MEYVMSRSKPLEARAHFRGEDGELHDLPLRLDLRGHSPTGAEWGYSGSGPSQLSLALLAHATGDDDLALRVYQAFKRTVVAKKRVDYWTIDRTEVMAAALLLDEADKGALFAGPPRRRVLIADDHADVAECHAYYFEGEGWEATVVSDGEAALDAQAQKGPFDLFVLDNDMPPPGKLSGTTGLEVAASLRKGGVTAPIVICSGRDIRSEANAAGAFFVGKGDPQELLRASVDLMEASNG